MAACPPSTFAARCRATFSGDSCVDIPRSLRCIDAKRQRTVDDRSSRRLRWPMPKSAQPKPPPHTPEEKAALGVQLANARDEAKFTLQGAAEELGRRGHAIKRGTISAWEKGRNVVDALWLRRLARLYNTTADALVGSTTHLSVWPFSTELQQKVLRLSDEELLRAENVLRAHLGLTSNSSSAATNSTKSAYDQRLQRPYPAAMEEGVGLPPHMDLNNLSTPSSHGRAKKHQRSARNKGGGGA
jgi:transcriptional regulator with XRE-family HTH domain